MNWASELSFAIGLGLVGALALWGVYRALELNWPAQYSSLNDTFALRLTQTWWRLALYRFVPVFGGGVAVWATASRLGSFPVVALWTTCVVHLLQSNVRGVFESFGWASNSKHFAVNHASYHAVAGALAIGATLCAWWLGPQLSDFVPRPRVLLENLWIALFIAVAAGVVVGVVGKRPRGMEPNGSEYLIWRARRDIGLDLDDGAFTAAMDSQADPLLLRAIMYAEALQRPRWVRRLERLKGRWIGEGTYGITQERSPKPITDSESIGITAAFLANKWALKRTEYGLVPDDNAVWRFAGERNGDLNFIEGVQLIYAALFYAPRPSVAMPIDHADVHIFEVRRFPEEFALRFFTDASAIVSRAYSPRDGVVAVAHSNPMVMNAVWTGEIVVPADVVNLNLQIYHSGQTRTEDVAVEQIARSHPRPAVRTEFN